MFAFLAVLASCISAQAEWIWAESTSQGEGVIAMRVPSQPTAPGILDAHRYRETTVCLDARIAREKYASCRMNLMIVQFDCVRQFFRIMHPSVEGQPVATDWAAVDSQKTIAGRVSEVACSGK